MRRVVVQVGHGKRLTYATDLPVGVGDLVEVPRFFWQPSSGGNALGTVVALDSDYDGDCKRIIRIVERPDVNADGIADGSE